MKLNRYITALFLATSGLLIAANHIVGGRQQADTKDKEKIKLSASYYAGLKKAENASYPRFNIGGAEDGVPYGLYLKEVKDKMVSFAWSTPEATNGYFENFEDHEDFAINSPGTIGWSYIDGDNRITYSWSATNFKNQGQKMAFIIMNPSATTPSVEENPNFKPTSGKKMLMAMCSQDAANNDWIISPELNFQQDFKLSFNARSYRTDGISPERMRVGYSTGGKSQSSFTFLTPAPYQELPAEWRLYEYTIPKEAKYICINCVSDDAFMMLIDDIFIGTNDVRPGIMPNMSKAEKAAERHLTGFNVYRDGKKVNKDLVTEIRYTDTADTYGNHDYTVSAVYSDGTESAQSKPLTVDVADPALLPFDEDFDNWYMDPAKWSTPENPTGIENYWRIDYYTYGLVDPSATYCYSALKDFDQSLVSRPLRTLDKSNTYLRFETRLEVWKIYPDETCYLAVEISNDNGKTWETIDTYNNRNGEEYWTVRLYPLKDYVKSDYFRLRWRCYGPTAMHIDYWYVDDIKVWNASFGQLRMNVSGTGGAVKDTEVKLTGTNGSKYSATTDASGNIAIGQIEADTYTVDIVKKGYNVYRGTVTVEDNKTTESSVHLTSPQLTISDTEVKADMAMEEKVTKSFTISNTGDGPMTWRMDYAPKKQSGKSLDFQVAKSWHASGDLQTSIAFDGEYYYTTSWYYLGEFWKYDKEGNLIEQFRIPDMYYKLYDLAYDGRYFYGSDYSNRLFQLDFENKRIVDIITLTSAPDLKITHVAYNPNNDRFYVGSWNTLCEVRRNGRTSSMAAAFDPDHSHFIYGSAYDNVTPGGPYLWLAAEENYNENMLDQVVIYQYDLNTKKFTGVKKTTTDFPGYVYGSPIHGINYICGLEGTVDKATGKYTLIGALQQSPSLFFEYNVGETDTWLSYSPKKATLNPGESSTVSVSFDARDAELNHTYSTTVPILTIPELDTKNVTLSFTASKQSPTPRPRNLTATEGAATDCVNLAWEKPSASVQSYNIYRNDKLVATVPEASAEGRYTDNNLVRGNYKYEVTAVYATGESSRSDSVSYTIKVGAPYYAPLELDATIAFNKDVTLRWKSPLTYAADNATVGWGTGEHADQLGVTSGGMFYAGSYWTADDLIPYRNKLIKSVSIRIVNPLNYLALCIFKDGERIVRKEVTEPITYGAWTTVTLDEPISIIPGYDYNIAFQVDHAEGMQPVSVDAANAVDGKGNLLSVDGSYWFPSSQMAIDGNFNIQFAVTPDPKVNEAAPQGYNIYRNGVKIANVPDGSPSGIYNDVLTEAGNYTYTVTSVYPQLFESLPSTGATVSVTSISERLAPNALASEIEQNRNVTLGWGYPVKSTSTFPVSILPSVTTTIPDYPTYVNSFLANASEMAVASDGKYIYTSVYTENGRINKYDIKGKYLDHFYIKGLNGVRNLTFDGTDFWAADGNTYICKVDMDGQTVLEQHNISEYARHLTYIPELDNGKGGFEVGDWETSIYVSRRGAKLGDGPRYKGAAGTAYCDGKLYAFEQGNANAHTISIYDFKTSKRIGEIDLENYSGLNQPLSAVAGGMSVVRTAEGLTFLALNAQNTQSTSEIIFLDASGVSDVAGYNVYRNGTKLNSELLTQRVFKETIATEGTYRYQIETVYIDGTVSPKSAEEVITILPTGTADAPTDLQAVPTVYGYDVALSFADPKLGTDVKLFQDFEQQQPGQPINISGWTNSDNAWKATDIHYHGSVAMTAMRDENADITLPADGNQWMQFFARSVDNIEGNITIYTSTAGLDASDFILLDNISLTEAWKEFCFVLPEGTKYISFRHNAGATVAVDALCLNPTMVSPRVWGYDIFRDGKQLNDKPVRAVSYIDHNLTPGVYSYQVRQQSVTAAISPLSSATKLNLNYSNGGQAPEYLRVTSYETSAAQLEWKAPALGNAINLKWHTGNSYDAAGLPNGGCFYAGVRWAAQDLVDYAHLSLSEVEVYINQIPDALFVLVYQGNNLVRRQYVPTLRQYSFNTIKLDDPLPIDPTKELRVVVYVEHNEITVPLGYDEGPARSGFGNLYSTNGITYTTMDNDETGIYGNWNITIGLRPYAATAAKGKHLPIEDKASSARQFPMTMTLNEPAGINTMLHTQKAGQRVASDINTFEGYNVYANNRLVNDKPIFTTSYLDTNNYSIYPYVQFKVSAVYSLLGEAFSNVVVISTDGINDVKVDADENKAELYNTAGQRITPSAKGIVISKGKKEVRK